MQTSYSLVHTCRRGFHLLTYVNWSLKNHCIGGILDCLRKGLYLYITFTTKSHRPEEAVPDSHDKCELGFKFNKTRYQSQFTHVRQGPYIKNFQRIMRALTAQTNL